MSNRVIILAGILFFAVFVVAFVLVFRGKIRKIANSPVEFGGETIVVPLLASFAGARFLPHFVALAYNNANPVLIFHREDFEHRVLSRRRSRYVDIEMVDAWTAPGTRNLSLRYTTSVFTFTANLYDEGNLKKSLQFLRDKGCPLSQRARDYLKN